MCENQHFENPGEIISNVFETVPGSLIKDENKVYNFFIKKFKINKINKKIKKLKKKQVGSFKTFTTMMI
jgi:hypothetical protein